MKQLVHLGDVAQINPRFDKSSLADDVPVSFVQMASVGAADGNIQRTQGQGAFALPTVRCMHV